MRSTTTTLFVALCAYPAAAAAQAPAAANWTGWYAGAFAGYADGKATGDVDTNTTGQFDDNGFMAGVVGGCRHQTSSNLVIGGELIVPLHIDKGHAVDEVFFPGQVFYESEGKASVMAGINVGYATGRLLPYAFANAGFAHVVGKTLNVDANDNLPSENQGYGMPNLADMFGTTPKVLIDQSDVITTTGDARSYTFGIGDLFDELARIYPDSRFQRYVQVNRLVGYELCLNDAVQAPQPLVEAVGSGGSSGAVYSDPDILNVGTRGDSQKCGQQDDRYCRPRQNCKPNWFFHSRISIPARTCNSGRSCVPLTRW